MGHRCLLQCTASDFCSELKEKEQQARKEGIRQHTVIFLASDVHLWRHAANQDSSFRHDQCGLTLIDCHKSDQVYFPLERQLIDDPGILVRADVRF